MEKKMVFLDIDGTLVSFGGVLPESTKEAIRRAKQNGHQMVICTGRSICGVQPELLELGFDGIVGASGAVAVYRGQELFHLYIPEERCRFLVDYMEKNDMTYMLQMGGCSVMTPRNAGRMERRYAAMGLDMTRRNVLIKSRRVCDPITDFCHVEKAVYHGSPLPLAKVQKDLAPDFVVTNMSFNRAGDDSGEITQTAVHKASGMEKLITWLGIPREATIAIGDGPNDPEMLEYARIGVAMGNAVPELKAIADHVTTAVDDDGIYNAFAFLGLI